MAENSLIRMLEFKLHAKRQLRILFFNDLGQLKPEAAYYFRWMQRVCMDDSPCYAANKLTGAIDVNATFVALGRREVWLEHDKVLNLDTTEIETQLNQLKEEERWQIKQTQQPR